MRVSAASVPRRLQAGGAAEEPEVRPPSGDSFGDPGHISHSPGFTSVLNSTSPGTMGWEEVNKTVSEGPAHLLIRFTHDPVPDPKPDKHQREEYLSPIKQRIIEQSVQRTQSRANPGGNRGSSDDIQQYLAQNLPVPNSTTEVRRQAAYHTGACLSILLSVS